MNEKNELTVCIPTSFVPFLINHDDVTDNLTIGNIN
jgi:hypothetical protein